MQDPAQEVDVGAAHGLGAEEVVGHELDLKPGLFGGEPARGDHGGQVLHDAAEAREGLREGEGGGAVRAADVHDEDCVVVGAQRGPRVAGREVVQRVAVAGREEGHGPAEALGAVRVPVKGLVEGGGRLVREGEALRGV